MKFGDSSVKVVWFMPTYLFLFFRGTCRNGVCVGFCKVRGQLPCVCSDESGNSCRRCCKVSEGAQCSPYPNEGPLPDGQICVSGFCKQVTVKLKAYDGLRFHPNFLSKYWIGFYLFSDTCFAIQVNISNKGFIIVGMIVNRDTLKSWKDEWGFYWVV